MDKHKFVSSSNLETFASGLYGKINTKLDMKSDKITDEELDTILTEVFEEQEE